jgi:hypothetical protein
VESDRNSFDKLKDGKQLCEERVVEFPSRPQKVSRLALELIDKSLGSLQTFQLFAGGALCFCYVIFGGHLMK